MAFTVFTVFMMCLITGSFVMYLAGLVLDAVRGTSGSSVDTAQQANLSLVRSEVSSARPGKSAAAAEYGAQTIYLCR